MSSPDFDLDSDAYRRRIRVLTAEPGVVRSELEDDFHNFVVTLRHDGRIVESVECESRRWPWATCPDAAEPLRKLAEMPLVAPVHGGRQMDRSEAELHASVRHRLLRDHARGTGTGRARVRRRDPAARSDDGRDAAALWVDGSLRLAWRCASGTASPTSRRRSMPRRGRAGSCAGPTRHCPRTTPSARSRCDARATSAWAAAWTSTACRSPTSFPR